VLVLRVRDERIARFLTSNPTRKVSVASALDDNAFPTIIHVVTPRLIPRLIPLLWPVAPGTHQRT
jgi:hypothetical protein